MDTRTTQAKQGMSGCMRGLLIVLAVFGVGFVALYGWLAYVRSAQPAAPPLQATGSVTLIGYTEVTTGHHVSTIDINDVPSGHYPFHAIATVSEGTRVPMISHDQNDVFVIAPNGQPGYVSTLATQEFCAPDCAK